MHIFFKKKFFLINYNFYINVTDWTACRLVYAIILININEAFGVFLVKLSCIIHKNTNCKMAKTTLNKKTKNNYSKNELKVAINSVLTKEKNVAQASRDTGKIS